jgi:ribosomal protein L28
MKLAKIPVYDSMLITSSHPKTMAKMCPITKRTSLVGGGYSNATRATQFNPTGKVRKQLNMQTKKIYIPELKKSMRLTISTRAIKTINKNGAFATLKKAGII